MAIAHLCTFVHVPFSAEIISDHQSYTFSTEFIPCHQLLLLQAFLRYHSKEQGLHLWQPTKLYYGTCSLLLELLVYKFFLALASMSYQAVEVSDYIWFIFIPCVFPCAMITHSRDLIHTCSVHVQMYEWIRKHSSYFYSLKEAVYNWHYFFLEYLLGFTSEPIWAWCFCFERSLVIDSIS